MSSVHLSLTVRADDLKVAYSAAFRLLEYLEDREPPTGRIEEESPTASGALVVGDPPEPVVPIADVRRLLYEAVGAEVRAQATEDRTVDPVEFVQQLLGHKLLQMTEPAG